MTYITGQQYKTQEINLLSIQKGVTFTQLVTTTTDLRGCLLFGEIRRARPGRMLIDTFTVNVVTGSNVITINVPRDELDYNVFLPINVREGDSVSIAGAGIINSTVLAVSGPAIFLNQSATRSLTETRMTVKAPVLASFTFLPKSDLCKISLTQTSIKEATSLAINGAVLTSRGNGVVFNQYISLQTTKLPISLKAGETVVFNRNNKGFPVTLAASANSGSTTLSTEPVSCSLAQGSTAIIGSSVLVTRSPIAPGAISIAVRALKAPIAKNAVLNFGYRDVTGWRQVGCCKVADSVLENSLTIPIYSYSGSQTIPTNSIAYFGTSSLSSFYIILEAAETAEIESGDNYACDIISVSDRGVVSKIVQIDTIQFTDIWTTIV